VFLSDTCGGIVFPARAVQGIGPSKKCGARPINEKPGAAQPAQMSELSVVALAVPLRDETPIIGWIGDRLLGALASWHVGDATITCGISRCTAG
jgi:hypothetical protein